jgi:uncharacterized protein with HEPN domain
MPKRVDKLLVDDIVKAIEEINQFVEGYTFESFMADAKTKAAVIRNLEIIGEAASAISTQTISQYPLIEWKQMKQLRNKLIHEYFGIDYLIVWELLQDQIPYNYEFLKKIQFTD